MGTPEREVLSIDEKMPKAASKKRSKNKKKAEKDEDDELLDKAMAEVETVMRDEQRRTRTEADEAREGLTKGHGFSWEQALALPNEVVVRLVAALGSC